MRIYHCDCYLNKGEQEFHKRCRTDSPYDDNEVKRMEAETRAAAAADKDYDYRDDYEFGFDIMW